MPKRIHRHGSATRLPPYRRDLPYVAFHIQQDSRPGLKGRPALVQIVVRVVGTLDAAQLMTQAALGHFTADAEGRQMRAHGAAQFVQRKMLKGMIDRGERCIQRVDCDMQHPLTRVAPSLSSTEPPWRCARSTDSDVSFQDAMSTLRCLARFREAAARQSSYAAATHPATTVRPDEAKPKGTSEATKRLSYRGVASFLKTTRDVIRQPIISLDILDLFPHLLDQHLDVHGGAGGVDVL